MEGTAVAFPTKSKVETIIKAPIPRKKYIDGILRSEALVLDQAVIMTPLRISGAEDAAETDHVVTFLGTGLPFSRIGKLRQIVFGQCPSDLAFQPIPDGSADVISCLENISQLQIPFDIKMDLLHRVGSGNYFNLLGVRNRVRYLLAGEYSTSGERRQRSIIGYEYGELASSPPSVIDIEMMNLGQMVDAQIHSLNELSPEREHEIAERARSNILSCRFISEESALAKYPDKEILVALLASELHRITAHIHPWYKRVGRTAEESRALLSVMCGVDPIMFSTPENRSTLAGYERGIADAVVAIPLLRYVAGRLRIDPENLYSARQLFPMIYEKYGGDNRLANAAKSLVFKSPAKVMVGHYVFPDSRTMSLYFSELHSAIIKLIHTMNLETLVQDPHSIYLVAQLLGRGRRISI